MLKSTLLASVVLVGGFAATAHAGATFDAIKEKGFIQCGANASGLAGFGFIGDDGEWQGMDVDFCRALAVAVFNDPQAVKFTPLTAKERFTALQTGEVDVLSRNTTWTASRDTSLGLDFGGVLYYDGQGFMVKKSLNVNSALELDNASVCVQSGTTTELNLSDYFRANGMTYEPVVYERTTELLPAYIEDRCDVFTTDQSGLYSERTKFANPDEHMILPEVISKEPLGPAVRHGDNEWGDIVRWTLAALVEAEEMDITSANVDELLSSTTDPSVKRFLGAEGEIGAGLGLDPAWAYNVVKTVGNYGEIFERNVGLDTPLQIERGINALWTDGGLQYAYPIR